MEYTLLVNEALQYGIPYNLAVQDRWPGATVVLYDVHSLMVDMYNNPSAYFDTPANSTGSYRNCDVNNVCTNSTNAPDTFLWYDELHPTVRTEQWIAKSFVDIVQWGNSSYATYWSSKQNY